MNLPEAWQSGQRDAREALSQRKARGLARLLLDDCWHTVAALPGLLTRTSWLDELSRQLGRVHYDLYAARRLWRRWQVWNRLRDAPLAPPTGDRWVYSFRNHRIGDKVVCSALFQYLRKCQPGARLVLIDDLLDTRSGPALPSSMFAELADEIWSIRQPSDRQAVEQRIQAEQLQELAWTRDLRPVPLDASARCCSGEPVCRGMPWLLLPRLARLGIFPRLSLPAAQLPADVLETLARNTGRPLVALHIVEDAPYNLERNTESACFEALSQRLARSTLQPFLVRLGQNTGRRLRLTPEQGLDLTGAGLTLAQSAMVLTRASVFVGGDSGPTHLAAALGVPRLVAIYPYSYDLEFTLRHCYACVRNTSLAETSSCFPSVPAQRLQKLQLRAHRFDHVLACEIIETQLGELATAGPSPA